MTSYNNFVAVSSIRAEEEEKRQARKVVLEKAKKKYEADERRQKKKAESGEGTWMLDTVSKRIHREEKTLEDVKSKSKKKKKKKKKKHHKHSDSSSASENSEDEAVWTESKPVSTSNISDSSSMKRLQRDSWMEAPIDLLPAISRQEIRDAANKEKEKAKMEAEKHLQPGQHARELNPYWKNGGSGVPDAPQSSSSGGMTGDGGLSWMLKSLTRMKQQAKDEQRSLEDIAAERYGSLDRLMSMIRDAEKSQGRGNDGQRRDRDSGGRRDYNAKDRDRDRERYADRNRESGRHKERSDEREDRRHGDDRDRQRQDDKNSSRKAFRFQRPTSDDEGGSERHYKSSRNSTSLSGESGRKMFKRPGDDEGDEKREYDKTSHRSGSRDESGDRGRGRRDGLRKSPQRGDNEMPRWKRKDASKATEEKEAEKKIERSRKKSSSDSSTSSSEDEGGRSGNKKMSDSEEEAPQIQSAPKVMSEAELNELAAKVMRAEIMGDEDLASQLKSTLEEARKVRESSKTTDGGGADFVHSNSMRMERGGKRDKEDEGDDNVVVLSRTNKAGMVRPVMPSGSEEWGKRAGKKKKRKNVETHSESGERTKFFHDDDKFDLKTLVEREKAGTAEDQNSMFARLAGREKDRDLDMDDMFVSKAARNHQEEESVNRDKMAAIMEHRKRSSAMDKCTRCFDKVPKHLIVAIGRKSYLCLPDHASLTEGHCLIVPMAHSSSATSLDEDVWQDIQNFRKSIVRMFLSQDKDVVVMETVMHLKYIPHMVIECIPLEQEVGDLAPIYFKKAMQEVGSEWSHNKKVHDLSKKDVRHTVPKGFPYFSVDFGLQGGFVHVIEDEATFSSYFGREIVGGMLDAEPGLWRKPRKQSFEDQRQKVLQFEKWWSPFDWTQDLD